MDKQECSTSLPQTKTRQLDLGICAPLRRISAQLAMCTSTFQMARAGWLWISTTRPRAIRPSIRGAPLDVVSFINAYDVNFAGRLATECESAGGCSHFHRLNAHSRSPNDGQLS